MDGVTPSSAAGMARHAPLLVGDPLLTGQQTLAIGVNVRARTENTPLALELQRRYPSAFATYNKQIRRARLQVGDVWIWRESTPYLAFLIVRESSVGATRPRYVDAAMLRLIRDGRLEGIKSLAIAPLGRDDELPSILEALQLTLPMAKFPVVIYSHYAPNVAAEAPIIG